MILDRRVLVWNIFSGNCFNSPQIVPTIENINEIFGPTRPGGKSIFIDIN